MSRSIRWLHLSDFHVGKDAYASRKLFEYILAHVGDRIDAGFAPDLVFVSGDLANRGEAVEYDEFWLEFALPLLERIGLEENRLFVVPGNHDVQRDENAAINRATIADPASRYFDPTPEGQKLRGMLLARFESYLIADLTAGAGGLRDAAGSYARVVEINGAQVGIAGVNTAWLSMDDADKEKLAAGKPLLEHALDTLADADLKVVVGHHPISWFVEAQQKPIKALLAKHSVLYLHGHLHHAWTEPTYGGADQFLAVQSGAAFQAREGEKWRNGLVWGHVDLDKQVVLLQAREWNVANQDWPISGDAYPEDMRDGEWWVYPTPGSQKATRAAERKARMRLKAPEGWELVEAGDLEKHSAPLADGDAVGFFDGAVPGWKAALSSSVPRRTVVGMLVEEVLRAAAAPGQPSVTLLLAPAGEGKSTALLQAAGEIAAGGGWRVARRFDDSAPVPRGLLDAPLPDGGRWLLIIDEADRVAEDLRALLAGLPGDLRPRVHALIACRDSDWLSSSASRLNWSTACRFAPKELKGLDEHDATAIVAAWTAFGEAGLGELDRVDEGDRVGALIASARDEMAKGAREAFFGALLAVRHGNDLQNHVRLLLERLGTRKISDGTTLRDALALVAAMHAEGFSFLSRTVLAEALGLPIAQLHQRVIHPLGREAAATSTSTYVLTRHRRIAQAAVTHFERDLGVDIGGVFVRLVEAALDARHRGSYVPNLGGWRFDVPNHFMDSDRPELAIAIGSAVLEREPESAENRINLAHLYRTGDDAALGAELLRESAARAGEHRGYYAEWGMCEGVAGDPTTAMALLGYAISDQLSHATPDVKTVQGVLNNLGLGFQLAYGRTSDVIFRDAQMAAAVIGTQFPKAKRSHLEKYFDEARRAGAVRCSVDEAFETFVAALSIALSDAANDDVGAWIDAADGFTFSTLRRTMKQLGHVRAPTARR